MSCCPRLVPDPVPVSVPPPSTSSRTGASASGARRAARTSGRTGGAGPSRCAALPGARPQTTDPRCLICRDPARGEARSLPPHALWRSPAAFLRALAQEEDRKDLSDIKGNTRSLINAKDMPKPAFAGSEMLRAHYGAMMPADKFHTPTLESHKTGGALGVIGSRQPFAGNPNMVLGANPLEPLGLSTRYGKINARLETNDPISYDERMLRGPGQ